jgi:hypothetical protein
MDCKELLIAIGGPLTYVRFFDWNWQFDLHRF